MTPGRELELEGSADSVRARLFVYDLVPFDLNVALARVGDLDCTPRASVEILPKSQMRYDEAYTDCDSKKIYLPEGMPSQLGPSFPHNRFTFAHELAHLVLGESGVRSRAVNGRDFRKQANVGGVQKEESDANFWASAFLMPTKIALECKTPEKLAKCCAVSVDAARIRLEGLARRQRRKTGETRPIPEKSKAAIAEIFRIAGVKPRSLEIQKLLEFKDTQARQSAEIQGYLADKCAKCGICRLVREGGCITCQACGESDCN